MVSLTLTMPLVEQIAARKRQVVELQPGALIVPALHAARREVAQQLRPGFLGIADDHAVGMADGFFGHQRRVHAAQHHGNIPRPERPRHLVGSGGGAGDDGDADQIGVKRAGIDFVHAFVDERISAGISGGIKDARVVSVSGA